ncbi:MAG: hypothetical protein JNL80_09730 [Phycisphaerae bacterium]|nr:hypothetical protein [Phycisphaerae bacterium]
MRTHSIGKTLPICILTSAAASALPSALYGGVVSTWIGPSGGAWSLSANWDNGVPGSSGVTDAIISSRRSPITVTLDSYPWISTLTIGPSCTLAQTDDHDLSLTGLTNDGLWLLQSTGSGTDIQLNADFTMNGSGAIELGDHWNNRILSVTAPRILTNGADHTIRGGGQLGLNNTRMVNHGLIEAMQPGGFWVDTEGSVSSINDGLMRSRDGSTLTFYSSPWDNTGGVIRAEAGSIVLFRYGSVSGGTIETSDSGELRTSAEACSFVDVTKNGTLRQVDDADCFLHGTITNNGPWYLDSTGSGTDIWLNTPTVTFTGSGAIEMGDHWNNRLFSQNDVRTLHNAAGHTIRGAGQVGNNNTAIVNDGTIEATRPTGLFIDVAEGRVLDNNALLRGRENSSLTLYGTAVDNADGVIRAEAGSKVTFRYGSVEGGLIETTGNGELRTTPEPTQFGNLTVKGFFRQIDDADSVVVGTISNIGTWGLESSGSGTDIFLNSPIVTFTGNGVIAMGNHINNRILSTNDVRTLVNAADHTIRGAGQIGLNNTALINDGLIEATLPVGIAMDIADGKVLENNGLIRARNGSTLTMYGTGVDNEGGVLRAEENSLVRLRYGWVNGGTLETTGSGEIRSTTEPTQFSNLTNAGLVRQVDDADALVAGMITNNSLWRVESSGSGSDLLMNSPTVTFVGTGAVELKGHSNARLFSTGDVRTLVNGQFHTIRGGGQIGLNNSSIQNAGLIEASDPVSMTIDPYDAGSFNNTGTIRVSGSGGMTITYGPWSNHGLVDIDPGCSLQRHGTYWQADGETRVDGTLTMPVGGYEQVLGLLSGSGVVNGPVSISGGSCSPSNVDGTALGTFTVNGSYVQGNDGGYVVDLGVAGNDHLTVQGSATLGGALQVRLDGGFVPMPGQEFTILTATSINSVYGCVEFPNAPVGYFTLVYQPTSVKLRVNVAPVQESDLNFDGVVNATDLAILLGAWGVDPCDNAICCPADLNGDGKVTATDLAVLLGDWS